MGWIEDSIEEFRKLPPAGKVAVGGAAVGVAILAYAQYRSSSASGASGSTANTANQGTSDPTGASALTGVGVPSLASSPADWQNWFSSGLSVPQTSFGASDGAPSSSSSPVATFTAPVFSAPDFVNTATAHVASSVAAPPPPPPPAPAPAPVYPIQNPLAASQIAHRGTTPHPAYTPPPPPPTVHTRGVAF